MPHSSTWLESGWRTSGLNLTSESIWFHRKSYQDPQSDDQTEEKTTGSGQVEKEGSETKPVQEYEFTDARGSSNNVVESTYRVGMNFEWEVLGEVSIDSHSKLAFPKTPNQPGLYRLTVFEDSGRLVYFGETDNLRRRFSQYRNPGPYQATNLRLNKLFYDAIADGQTIELAIMVDHAWIEIDERERKADFSIKSDRLLLENGAIVSAQSEKLQLLNL